MSAELGPVEVTRRTGTEKIGRPDDPRRADLLSFWQWSGSDLLGNTQRGVLAEYLVALDLGIADGARDGWTPFDLRSRDGITIEVKASAYIQSWKQTRYSTLSFGIGRTLAWHAESNEFEDVKRRQADVYVFCVLAHKDQTTIDPLDVDQWTFHVLATSKIDKRFGGQKRVSLPSLIAAGARPAPWGSIEEAVRHEYRDRGAR